MTFILPGMNVQEGITVVELEVRRTHKTLKVESGSMLQVLHTLLRALEHDILEVYEPIEI